MFKHIYTIGNCSGVSHAEAKKWRDEIKEYFDTYSNVVSVKVINITDYYSYEEKFHETDKEMAKLTVITLWLTSNIKKDDINWEGCF